MCDAGGSRRPSVGTIAEDLAETILAANRSAEPGRSGYANGIGRIERPAECVPLVVMKRPESHPEAPWVEAAYSALLMQVTQGKCYTPLEYGALLEESGFRVGPYQETLADRGFMTAVRL